jgi:hypothetical protein
MLYIPDPIRVLKRRLLRKSEGERFLRERYHRVHGSELDIDNPKTFTEKLYRRMIETNRGEHPIFTQLADKYLARAHVSELAGPQYLIPLLWVGADPAQIPFDALPSKCIAMTNHGSGGNMVLEKPVQREAIIEIFRRQLAKNFYWVLREFQYHNIKPRVMVEEFISDGCENGPLDYRFWCFNGKPEVIQVDNNAHTINAFYTPKWELTDCTYRSTDGIRSAHRPDNLDELIDVARKLSSQFDFVRIDLYSVKGRVYFGEFTFTPTAGTGKFDPPRWDLHFGEKWQHCGA